MDYSSDILAGYKRGSHITFVLLFLYRSKAKFAIMKPVTNRGIVELNPSSSEEEAKKLYDSWAANYEAVS